MHCGRARTGVQETVSLNDTSRLLEWRATSPAILFSMLQTTPGAGCRGSVPGPARMKSSGGSVIGISDLPKRVGSGTKITCEGSARHSRWRSAMREPRTGKPGTTSQSPRWPQGNATPWLPAFDRLLDRNADSENLKDCGKVSDAGKTEGD